MGNARLVKHKLESRLLGEISITSDMQMTPPLRQKKRRTKVPLDQSEGGEWKSWLKAQHSENEDHGIWSHHFMANRWATVETVANFILGGFKITADGDCSHEIKRRLLLGRKVITNLDSILKSRDFTSFTKVCSRGYGFSSSHIWMWELGYKESWVLKNWCFLTVVLEKTLKTLFACKDI